MPDTNTFPGAAAAHLKEVAWAVLMIDFIFVLLALLFRPHLGTRFTLIVIGGMAAVITLFIGGAAVLNVLLVWLYERWERRAGSGRRSRP